MWADEAHGKNYQQRIECHTLKSHEIRLCSVRGLAYTVYPLLSPRPKQRPLLRLKVVGAIFWSITKLSQQSIMREQRGCSQGKGGNAVVGRRKRIQGQDGREKEELVSTNGTVDGDSDEQG